MRSRKRDSGSPPRGEPRRAVLVLQGVGSQAKHHIWSCADKGGVVKPAGSREDEDEDPDEAAVFFKEANCTKMQWTLRELLDEQSPALKTMCFCVRLLGGS